MQIWYTVTRILRMFVASAPEGVQSDPNGKAVCLPAAGCRRTATDKPFGCPIKKAELPPLSRTWLAKDTHKAHAIKGRVINFINHANLSQNWQNQ